MPSAPPVTTWRPAPVARVRSWLGDWFVVAAWLGLLALVGLLTRPLLTGDAPAAPSGRQLLVADLLITLATVVPFVVYLSVTESSRRRATLGKRWAGLVVVDASGGRAGTGQVWLRNIVKALPWEIAHLGVTRAIFEVQTAAAITLTVLSLVLAAACAAPALIGGRGLHDRMAGTRVERASWSPAGGAAP
ncbi:RDD family protein [Ornithinimicrobium avium]|uniref:RDD domain-containing protein n=1 Tax=Ornithinimicrobium avium TaxID=2283195 RepID=A0A345NIN5_9MICO|nr:RDD family protein [Ornithinimicrobium avium]AXH94893.1 hypothetical protein DV701_00690 [Ornithinimicrobium avium]